MINFIYGKKGSGKTKKMIDLANKAVDETLGKVVFVDDNRARMFDLKHSIRLISTDDYDLDGPDFFMGFLTGIIAADFDTTSIFVDSFLTLSGKNVNELDDILKKLERLCAKNNVKMVISISAAVEDLPEYIKQRTIS